MSQTQNTISNVPPVNDRCITCLCPFGIQIERIPCKCTNVKCGRQFCAQCVNQIQIYNGNDRSFRCMYCLQEYRQNSLPEENETLIKQLWNESTVRYDIKHTHDLLLEECTYQDLRLDIDCRRRHLMNLGSLYKRYCGRTQFLHTTENLINQLTELIQYINDKQNDNLSEHKAIYRRLISTVGDDQDIGFLYISLCERLQLEISEAEYCSMFPKINTKIYEQSSANEFQPKIIDLLQTLEQDLVNQWKDPYLTARTKIGIIGYRGVGKSSLLNWLLDVNSLTEDDVALVSVHKSTYFPLQFDRKQPLISPDDQKKKTLVTFVDIPSADKIDHLMISEVKENTYVDEICKADCDIYVLVYDENLHEEQQEWINYIEEGLKRKCVLVRSKVDIYCLNKLQELFDTSLLNNDQSQHVSTIIEQLRLDSSIESRSVFLVAYVHAKSNRNAELVRIGQSLIDFSKLLNELGRLAFDACSCRIHALAHRTIARAVNTSFRRSYVLNVMKYKVAAGFASIIPFGDQLPRYLSRDGIRDAFGIDDALRQYLTPFHLVIYNYKLQTSVFAQCVEVRDIQNNSKLDTKWVGRTAGAVLVVGGGFTEDILRVAAPAATAFSGAARAALTVATIGIGVVISAGVSAWSAVDSGKHIFSYINRICDDIIMISNPLITSIIGREREKVYGNSLSPPVSDVQNK